MRDRIIEQYLIEIKTIGTLKVKKASNLISGKRGSANSDLSLARQRITPFLRRRVRASTVFAESWFEWKSINVPSISKMQFVLCP